MYVYICMCTAPFDVIASYNYMYMDLTWKYSLHTCIIVYIIIGCTCTYTCIARVHTGSFEIFILISNVLVRVLVYSVLSILF